MPGRRPSLRLAPSRKTATSLDTRSSPPANPVATDLYVLLAIAPMFAWDVIRNKRVHVAYLIWLPVFVAVAATVDLLWDKPWWHATAKAIMRV